MSLTAVRAVEEDAQCGGYLCISRMQPAHRDSMDVLLAPDFQAVDGAR